MAGNWTVIAEGAGVGAVAGILDRVIETQDIKRKADFIAKHPPAPGEIQKTLSIMGQFGTWYNYVLPILTMGLAGVLNYPKSPEMQASLATAAGQLASRRVTEQVIEYSERTGAEYSGPRGWHAYGGEAAVEAARAARAAEAAAGRVQTRLAGSRGSL